MLRLITLTILFHLKCSVFKIEFNKTFFITILSRIDYNLSKYLNQTLVSKFKT